LATTGAVRKAEHFVLFLRRFLGKARSWLEQSKRTLGQASWYQLEQAVSCVGQEVNRRSVSAYLHLSFWNVTVFIPALGGSVYVVCCVLNS